MTTEDAATSDVEDGPPSTPTPPAVQSILTLNEDSQNGGTTSNGAPGEAFLTSTSGASASSSSFEEHYELHHKVAEGSFGTVFVTKHKSTGQEYAVKLIDRRKLTPSDNDNVAKEVKILTECRDVGNIVTLINYYESPDTFYLVQILAEGGDVFERLATRASYNEKVARDLTCNLMVTMQQLHARKVCHRDLKPENLLLRSVLDDTDILVADFGFAAYVPEDGLKTRCGTPAFVAPEVLIPNGRYDEKCDMWSVGCLLYMLIGGYPPFQGPNHRSLFRKIRGADFCFHDEYWKNVSVSAKQLIASLLTIDPKYRCTATMALEKSNWLKMAPKLLEKSDLSASLAELKKFKARTTFKGAVHTVLWSVRTKFKSNDYQGFSKQVVDWNKSDEAQVAEGSSIDDRLTTSVRPTLKFEDVYELNKQIYQGRSSTIWECLHKDKQETFAVKIIDRDPGTPSGRAVVEMVLHEVAVLNSLDNPYILKIIDFFDEDDEYYLVMEMMDGGDVFDRILKKKRYTEKDAQGLARFLLEAVSYLHAKGICHRDLKPQNLLLKSKNDDAEIKIAGFGFACRVHTPQSLTKRCGTPTYVAPEILKNIPYDQSVDMWSVGVILFVLLCGYPPFADENQNALFEKVRCGEYIFHEAEWRNVTDDAKDLIRNLLVVDPARRWTAKEALNCKWLLQKDELLENSDLTQNLVTIKKRRSRLRSVAKAVIFANCLGDSLRDLALVEDLLARPETDQGDCDHDMSCSNFQL